MRQYQWIIIKEIRGGNMNVNTLKAKRRFLLTMMGILFVSTSFSFANEKIGIDVTGNIVETSVKINENYLAADTKHILVGDTVFVVGRHLVEALGGTIEWIEATQTVKMVLDEKIIEIIIDSDIGQVNGEPIDGYKAPFLKDGRTMIPLRLVSEYFGCEVIWNQSTYTVQINKEGLVIPDEYILIRSYTDEDLYLLSKIVTVESGDASLEMALAIANTIMNRVKDPRFPETIEGVIYQVDVYKQFPPVHKASFDTLEPKYLSTIAAKKTLEGINNIGNSLFFNNQPFKSKKDDLIKIIDGEYFYH